MRSSASLFSHTCSLQHCFGLHKYWNLSPSGAARGTQKGFPHRDFSLRGARYDRPKNSADTVIFQSERNSAGDPAQICVDYRALT